jgi:hypothetical protein
MDTGGVRLHEKGGKPTSAVGVGKAGDGGIILAALRLYRLK